MNIKLSFLLTTISGLSTLLGSLILFIKTKRVEELIVFSLSFSLGIMVIISIFELLPSSINILINNYNLFYGLIISILIFIFGYLTIFMIDYNLKNYNSLGRIGVMNFISLMIHNLPEGIIVFMTTSTNIKLGIKMCLAIMFHNIPEGISISIPLFYSNECSRGKSILLTLLSGLSEVVGALLCYIILKDFINDIIISFIQIFTSGIMISLSISKILKEALSYNKSKYILMGISSSCLISLILLFL